MRLNVFAATAMVAVFAGGHVSTTHTSALSHTTSTNVKLASATIKPQPAIPASVTVAPGDTLSSIAAKYSTTYVRLFDANSQIQNPDVIYASEVISIPTATAQLPDRYGEFETAAADADAAEAAPVSAPVNETPQAAAAPAVPAVSTASAADTSVWTEIAQCESGGNWSIDTGNGFYGGLQFTLSSWHAVGGTGMPNQASEAEQIALAEKLQAMQGWGAWPVCSAKLGL